MSTCHSNPEKSLTAKLNKDTASDYSLFTNFSFDTTEIKLDCYRGKCCMEGFCKDLKEQVIKIFKCEKKEMIPSTNEEGKLYRKLRVCYICKKKI